MGGGNNFSEKILEIWEFFPDGFECLSYVNRGFLMPILGKDNNTQMNKKNQLSIDFYKIYTSKK